jgi:hypothetical protein
MNRPLKFLSRHWLATTALILAVSGSAMAAGTLVQIQANDALVATANPLPVTVVGSGGGGAATIADGADVTQGAKADAKSTATDTTAVTIMSVTKQISASAQATAASVAGSLTVGTHAVTQSGTWTVQPGNTANTTPWLVTLQPTTSGGSSAFSANVTTAGSGAGTGGVAVDATTGQLYGYAVYNGNSSVCYLDFYDQTQALTNLGTTTPKMAIGIPANGGANLAFPNGIPFATAITVSATTTRAGSTACSTGLDINAWYK